MSNEKLPIGDPVFLIETDKIDPNPYQPRKNFDIKKLTELANSIRELGILQPLVVTKLEKETEHGTQVRYELIAGERRLRAAQMLRMPRVPSIIKNIKLDQHRLEMAIVENVQRSDLNPLEAARAYSRLQDEFSLTQREIASRIGKSRESVANTMRLLNLPTEMQKAVAEGRLSESQARLLLSVDNLGAQQTMFQDILDNNLSVRDLKKSVDRYKRESKENKRPSLVQDPNAISLQKALEDYLGAQVKLDGRGGSGKITIAFHSADELRNLVEKLTIKESPKEPLSTDELLEKSHSEDLSSEMGLLDEETEGNPTEPPLSATRRDSLKPEAESPAQRDSLKPEASKEEIDLENIYADNREENSSFNNDTSVVNLRDPEPEETVTDDFNHSKEEHAAMLPTEESEKEVLDHTETEDVLDERDQFDPFKFHGI